MPLTKDFPRYTIGLACIIALVIALVPPAVYFALSWQALRISLEKEAETDARKVSLFVAANPLMWQFDEVRLNGLLGEDIESSVAECRIVHDLRGVVAKRCPPELPWPVASRSHPVWDAGSPVGRMEIRVSARPLVRTTAMLGAGSTLLSGIALTMFFLYPLSSLHKALGALWEMKERVQVTLQSIADGVIAIDTGRKILLMNRVAETITGWPSKVALGKSLDEVFRLDAPGWRTLLPGRSVEPQLPDRGVPTGRGTADRGHRGADPRPVGEAGGIGPRLPGRHGKGADGG